MDNKTKKIFQEFKKECKKRNVMVRKKAMINAKQDFNLNSQTQILNFIANDGLEDLKFFNKKKWENNPAPDIDIMVYAFKFKTSMKPGYIAFFKGLQGKWIIKSFKLDYERSRALEEAINKALK